MHTHLEQIFFVLNHVFKNVKGSFGRDNTKLIALLY